MAEPEKVEYLNGGDLPEFDNDKAYFAFEIKDGEVINKQIATKDDLMDWMRISFTTEVPGPVKFNRIWR
jgi:hypothetical protein